MCIFGGGDAGKQAVEDTRTDPRAGARGDAIAQAPKVAASKLSAMYGGARGGRGQRSTVVNAMGGEFVKRSGVALTGATASRTTVLGG